MVVIKTCQCQNCIHCHGGGCTEEAVMVIRFKEANRKAEIGTCELCGLCLLGSFTDIFEKVERGQPIGTQ